MKSEKVEETYKKVTQIQHILLRPDTYVGSISSVEDNMWIFNDDQIILEKIKYVPGLYKIFDEILVNAADNYQRDNKMTKIQVDIQRNGTITVMNDGKSIPIQIHKQHKIYVSELIFGHLLTSSNYQDNNKKVTGGRNGYGSKLANIFSKQFVVQTGQLSSKKKLRIEWKNNMSNMLQPQISPYTGKDYTKIIFTPDYQKFGMKNLTRQMNALLKKRVYDMAGILKVKVFFNGQQIPIKSFKDYVKMYVKDQTDLIFDDTYMAKRWSVMVTKSQGQFQQISFVNGIHTSKGGAHVNHIADQIVEKLLPNLKKKAKDITIKPFQIKNFMRIFVNCLIQNPAFDSQTKQTLTTAASKFGSTYQVTDKMIRQIQKSGMSDRILSSLRAKQNTKIEKHLKRIQNSKFIIPKLQQANLAGKSTNCTLILTQGDSAKTLAMSGLQKLKRDLYGVFPLRGKLVNVREMTVKQVMDNHQLSNIVKILGLIFGKEYQSTDQLRYASVMIMADQDIDGSHIKGLIINFFQTFWPSLCKINGFLKQFVTPIIRCKQNNVTVDFFSQTDYQVWKINAGSDWKIKYYKGLGTSTHLQAKQYFTNLQKHQIQFKYSDEKDREAIDLAFNKKLADSRKRWLQKYDHTINVDYRVKTLKIEDFINQEFIHFSISDNIRSIPSAIDGLKPSQRKILFACFKRNLRSQIKVAQLTGYVAEHSAYHHGQMSLSSTIIGMAQNYIGSNNLNLLQPIGQFGTRYMNGKDHASARYIFTNLNPLTRYLFHQADDHVVQYIQQENMIIQPKFYVPILPLILINGAEGIGTGWSTMVYPHKVDDVIRMIRNRIHKQSTVIKVGWEGYKGQIIMDKQNSYIVKGIFQIEEETVIVTEIPIGRSIRDFKSFLQQNLDSIDNKEPDIQDIRQYHQDGKIHFDITFIQGRQPIDNSMQKYLKLSTTIQQNNMVLFNSQKKLIKYDTIQDIVEQFYQQRIKTYTKRKQYLVSRFQREFEILQNKMNFIKQVINGKFKLMDKKQSWIKGLIQNKFTSYNELTKTKSTKQQDYTVQNQQQNTVMTNNKDFNYLLSLPIWNFCQQKINELEKSKNQIQTIMTYYRKVSQIQLWQKDLQQFQKVWRIHQQNAFDRQINAENKVFQIKRKTNMANNLKNNKTTKRSKKVESNEDEQIDEKQEIPQRQANRQIANSSSLRSKTQKNLMSQQVQKLSLPSKKLKPLQKISQPIAQSNIDSILNKYLLTSPADGLSFQQRLKAKLASYQNSFSYDKQNFEKKDDGENNGDIGNMQEDKDIKDQELNNKHQQKDNKDNKEDKDQNYKDGQKFQSSFNQYDWML